MSSPADRIRLDGRAFVVTGAAGGIGKVVARTFVDAGASVVAQVRATALPADLADRVETYPIEMTNPDAGRLLVDRAIATFGRIDGAVNNAGIQGLVPYEQLDDGDWSEMMEVNLHAARRLTDAVAHSAGTSGASVVHVSSIEARHPTVWHGHYSTAKAALVAHAKAAALALGPNGVRVNAVLPGLIDRDGLAEAWPEGVARWLAAAPLGRLGTASDVADACLFLCSDMSRWITGAELVVDGGVLTGPTW